MINWYYLAIYLADLLKLVLSRIIFGGFVKQYPLLQVEEDVLYWGVLARLATSYVMSFYELSKQPENAEYLKVQSSKCPDLIKLLWEKGKDATLEYWKRHANVKICSDVFNE